MSKGSRLLPMQFWYNTSPRPPSKRPSHANLPMLRLRNVRLPRQASAAERSCCLKATTRVQPKADLRVPFTSSSRESFLSCSTLNSTWTRWRVARSSPFCFQRLSSAAFPCGVHAAGCESCCLTVTPPVVYLSNFLEKSLLRHVSGVSTGNAVVSDEQILCASDVGLVKRSSPSWPPARGSRPAGLPCHKPERRRKTNKQFKLTTASLHPHVPVHLPTCDVYYANAMQMFKSVCISSGTQNTFFVYKRQKKCEV